METLEDPDVRLRYVTAIQNTNPALQERIRDLSLSASPSDSFRDKLAMVNAMELDFTSTLLNIAKSVIGKKRVPILPSGPTPQPSPEYSQAESELQHVYQALRRNPDNPEPLLADRDRLKLKIRSIVLRDRTRAYRDWLQHTGSLPIVQVMKIVRRIRRSKAAAGASLATTPIALDSYRNHFAGQFQNSFGIADFVPPSPPSPPSLALAQEIFTQDHIARCISFSRSGKAPGITGLTTDLLRPAAITLSSTLEIMYTTYYILGVVPSSWTRALICPVPKKGDLSHITNYRPISLTETSRKLFELCLLRHLQPLANLSREQGGFRSSRSTIDQVEALDKLIRSAKRQHRRHPEMAFLDIKAAYDSVPRGELWRRCVAIGFPDNSISCLRSLFDHNSAQLVVKQSRSTPFSQPAGVLQGSVLSPLLYSVYIDPLVEALRSGPLLQLPNGHGINCLMYADDIVVVARDPSSLRQLLLLAEADSIARGYRFSPSKCVTLTHLNHSQSLYDAPMPIEDHFNYLGVEFNCSGIDEALHVKNRAGKLLKQADALASIGARYLGFPRICAIRLFKAFLRPGLEYAITLMVRNKANLASLDKAQKLAICKILGFHKNSHSVTTLAMAGCPNMTTRRACLGVSRQNRLVAVYNSPDRLGHALHYVSVGLNEPPPIPAPLTRTEIMDEHFDSRRDAIATRFGNTISTAGLLLPLSRGIPWSESRMLVLWLLRKFDCFDASRLCRACSHPIRNQAHVSFCGNISIQLQDDDRIAPLPDTTITSIAPVEMVLAQAELLPSASHRATVKALSEAILNAVNSVFGASGTRT
jgi:hypothetical protein